MPEEETIILNITRDDLSPEILCNHIYTNNEVNTYWTDDWSSGFYSSLAKAGFIATSIMHEDLGAVLLPEIQFDYAVLDWRNLHISRKIKKIINSGFLENEEVYLTLNPDLTTVLEGINNYHEENWLIPEYRNLLNEISKNKTSDISPFAVELWQGRTKRLVAGEIGYAIGGVYTSLSGFCIRESGLPNWGTIQLVMLSQVLENSGFEFWNLGHPYMDYKTALGANVLDRRTFLQRWFCGINQSINSDDLLNNHFYCDVLRKQF